jgi:hypothetical protein
LFQVLHTQCELKAMYYVRLRTRLRAYRLRLLLGATFQHSAHVTTLKKFLPKSQHLHSQLQLRSSTS